MAGYLCACARRRLLIDGVRLWANDRQGLERLLRYCARARLLRRNGCADRPEHLVYESPKPGPGGTLSQILTPWNSWTASPR